MTPEQAKERAQKLLLEAREHKRLSSHHRNESRRSMEAYRQLCERYGIEVHLNGGEQAHGRREGTPQPID